MTAFEATLQHYQDRAEQAIWRLLPDRGCAPAAIHEVMHYCLAAGGKRLRPVLLLACADLYPQVVDPAAAAAAVEFLHTYSLVHDDLPCMDDSPLRRGQPSAHVAFGETLAVLAGDALLTEAFALLARAYADQPAVGIRLLKILGEAADSRHLIGGQVVDTLSESVQLEGDQLDFIHQHKTADLLAAACRMGLAVTTAGPQATAVIGEIGNKLGFAFQVVDDILDATSDTVTMGKTVRADAQRAKNTYVSLHGLAASRAAVGRLTSEAIAQLDSLSDADCGFLRDLFDWLAVRVR